MKLGEISLLFQRGNRALLLLLAAAFVAGCGAEVFVGQIDEVEIFNRALSAEQIQAVYNAGSAGKCRTPEDHITAIMQDVANLLASAAIDEGNANALRALVSRQIVLIAAQGRQSKRDASEKAERFCFRGA